MVLTIILAFTALCCGMGISVWAFGTGGKRRRIFGDIYFTAEDVDGIGVVYTKTGEYSAILKIENPVQKYCADIRSYYDFNSLFTALTQTLGEGYAIQKQDIFVRKEFEAPDSTGNGTADSGVQSAERKGPVRLLPVGMDAPLEREFLTESYFRYFTGRPYTESSTYLTITQENRKARLFSYDGKRWRDFLVKVRKIQDQLRDANVSAEFLTKAEAGEYADRFFAMDFKHRNVSMSNFKVDDDTISMGDRICKIFSLVDVDCISLPSVIRPYADIEVNGVSMPADLASVVDNIPGADTVVYNQIMYIPNQKKELGLLEKKKNRHASVPNPANLLAVEDIKKVQEVIARENRQLIYSHFNVIVGMKDRSDIQKVTNHLENSFSRLGIHISKHAFNQLELFTGSFPGNAYALSEEYDRFLTLSDAAACLMYKEHTPGNEATPFKVWYTDRQGVPVAIDISGKEGKRKLTDNSNFFVLGPSGSGKSFYVNSMVRQAHEQGTDIVLVDTGNSYEGLCEYFGGKYISYTEEHPITMNPFNISPKELNIEKTNFLKNLVLQIWKGSHGTVTKTEDTLIAQAIREFYEESFRSRNPELSYNSFYEYAHRRIPAIIAEERLSGIDTSGLFYQMKAFYRGGVHENTLNESMDTTLFDEPFIVFEIDTIKDDPVLFPIVTLIIMDVFLQKMRIKKNRKMLIIEEAWKAIASPMMAEYIKYLYKTARKFWASVGVVTQEIQDIIGSEIVKEAIINNSDVVMLLDQSKFRERFDEIKAILGLTDVDCRKIFTINRLDNKAGRSFFREVFIRRGSTSGVYGVEEPRECYMTYTTERAEKDALKLYKRQLDCSHQEAIEAYCRDWNRSGISGALEFARKVNDAGKVLDIK